MFFDFPWSHYSTLPPTMAKRVNIYIDGNNLHRAAKGLGFAIDYKKLRGWLSQKYKYQKIYLFIGFMIEKMKFYDYLAGCGFTLVFKPTISVGGIIKGNCDAELTLKISSDFYKNTFDTAIVVTGDGDFSCIIDFLLRKDALERIVAPNKNGCSFLIRNKNVDITFLNEHYHKFYMPSKSKKAPDADGSA